MARNVASSIADRKTDGWHLLPAGHHDPQHHHKGWMFCCCNIPNGVFQFLKGNDLIILFVDDGIPCESLPIKKPQSYSIVLETVEKDLASLQPDLTLSFS